MFRQLIFGTILCIASKVHLGNGYRILCVFPSPSISHQVVFRGLTLALNKRGHELIVVTPNPMNDSTLANYTEIDVSFEYDAFSMNFVEIRGKLKWMDWFPDMSTRFISLMDRILNHPDMRKMYAPGSGEKFDLLLVETLYWESSYPLATRFGIPTIGISSLALSMNIHYAIGNPMISNGLTNWELGADASEALSFWQRLKNFIHIYEYVYWYETTYLSQQETIARKFFGNDIPALSDLTRNISLILVNQQRPISYAVPNIPKVIEIGGFHVSKGNKPLPKELQRFLDGATKGFVYMSLGTNAKSTMLSQKTIEQFITAFSRLPYKVLWKFEDDVLPGKPDNVHIMKWVPQQAVLAHPNLKVFIYQGGVQSTEEAVHHAVPLIGIPILADQDMQVMKIVSLGVAKRLEIAALDADELFDAISAVASDSSYKQRMLNLRSLMEDTPHDPLENAMWWIEHVIRHRGAPQLHSTTADQPWYSRQDMDIVAFISAGVVIILCLTLIISHYLIKLICKSCFQRIALDAKKTN